MWIDVSHQTFRAVSEFAIDALHLWEEDEEGQKPTGMVCELDPECDEDDEIVGIFESLSTINFLS